jgi:hypothetical protein
MIHAINQFTATNQDITRHNLKSPEEEVPGGCEIRHLRAKLASVSGRGGRYRHFFRRFPETPYKLMMPLEKKVPLSQWHQPRRLLKQVNPKACSALTARRSGISRVGY